VGESVKAILGKAPPPWAGKAAGAALLAGAAAVPLAVRNSYITHVAIQCLIYSALAISLNIIIGLSGQFSLGHVTFYGMGAYACTLLMMRAGLGFWASLAFAVVFCAAFGALLAAPTLRLRGDYVAVVTLGFGEVFRLFLMNTIPLTRGPMGIPGIPSPSLFGFPIDTKARYYYLFLALLAALVLFVGRLVRSGFGLAVLSINDDPVAATAIGINAAKFKLASFVIGAAIAGAMGGLYASYMGFIGPSSFAYSESISMVAMVVLGGLGSVAGSILGAVALTVLPEALRSLSEYRMVVFGAAMVAVMIFRPNGIWGLDRRRRNAYLDNVRGGPVAKAGEGGGA
jgi:branched-chain amino acid transport system permease protein